MSLHLGRIVLPEPTSWASTGANGPLAVTVVGNYKASSLTDGLVKRDQILSLANNGDEPIIPVIMDNEPRVTGYYRVLGSSFTTDEFTRLQGNLYNYQVDLEPVQGFTQPLLESVISGTLLTNVIGGVLGDVVQFHGYPAVATEYFRGAIGATQIRPSADGNINFSTNGGISTPALFSLVPSSFYVGAATFEQGSALQPVVGRVLAQADVVNWRLSNGLVRVIPGASVGDLSVTHWTGGAWGTAKIYSITPSGPDSNSETITTSGAVQLALQSIATFKPSGTPALVGALGTLTTGTPTTVSPTFGQATVAGHLLVAWVNTDAIVPTVVGAGWVETGAASGVWYKPNCGAGEAAPVFNCVAGNSGNMTARLAEFSGVATASPLDQNATQQTAAGITTNVAGAPATDAVVGNLVITETLWILVSAATASFTDTGNNGAMTSAGDTGASSLKYHARFAYGVANTPVGLGTLLSVTVLRNSTEECDIRLAYSTTGGLYLQGRINVDLSLRRGDRLVRGLVMSDLAQRVQVARKVTEAATAITFGAVTLGGIRATANDADGNRYVLVSYQTATTSDLVNGKLTQNAASTSMDFGIGCEIGGSGASGIDTATSLAKQYLAAQSESQRIVQR